MKMLDTLMVVEQDGFSALVSVKCVPKMEDGLLSMLMDAELVIAIDDEGETVEL